jgi:hypothetical protein
MLEPEVIRAEQEWAQSVVTNAKSILIRNNKRASGRLINSIRYSVAPNGTIKFMYAEEGKYVEQGRRPGDRFPPPAPINRWIRQKGIKGISKDGKPISEKSLTFLISRSIARKGIRPLPFIRDAVRKSVKQFAPKLAKIKQKAMVQRLRKDLRSTIKK